MQERKRDTHTACQAAVITCLPRNSDYVQLIGPVFSQT